MLRLFVGIGFPPELKLRLSLLCSGVPGAKWVDPGNFHLTLRFIGEIGEDVAADIDDALSRLRARRVHVADRRDGRFRRRRQAAQPVGRSRAQPRARRAARQGRAGADSRRACRRSRANSRRTSLWRGCATRRSTSCSDFLAAHAQFRADPLPVEGFSLIASFQTKAGSVYEDQADYPLLH